MTVLEITVQRKLADTWPVVLERSQPGELPTRAEGELDLGADWSQQLLALALDPLAYGTVLGKALLRDAIRDAFVTARNESGEDLRTLLVVEDEALKLLHWERLCAPIRPGNKWGLLGLDQRSIFSLYLPSLADRRFPAIGRRDLRALVLVANPPEGNRFGLDRFDEPTTVAGIRAALGDLPCDLLAGVGAPGVIGRPTLDELAARITGGNYTLLHVVAHGWYNDASGETTLYLLDSAGQVAPVPATHLVERLEHVEGTLGLPRLAFLATCESARPEAERAGSLGGLAQRLVRELGLPAVVAMTQKVSVNTATALAREFYIRLRAHGEADRALVQAAAGAADASDITVPALYGRLAGRPLFSDTPDRELTDSEIEYGLDELAKQLPERAPILQDTFAAQEAVVRGTPGPGRGVLSEASRRERNDALAGVNTLCEEVLDLDFRALAFGKLPPAYDPRCPFRGLLAFGYEDRAFLFGREALVEKLRGKLAIGNFLPVLGPSGSGKSSLVLAGLIPALLKAEPDLPWVSFTPGRDPLAQLDASLSKLAASLDGQPISAEPIRTGAGPTAMPATSSVAVAFAGSPDGQSGDARAVNRRARLLLVVDQFEELFTLSNDEQTRCAFLERLLSLAREQRVVITMRADFWGDCAPYPRLKEVMQASQELIPPMTAVELRSAMEQQAKVVGLRFEADLSNTVLDEVQGEPGAMPLLQHLLRELWARRHGRWLRAAEYRVIGGIRQAIARTADRVYGGLTRAEQDQMRDIFLRLTRLDEVVLQSEDHRDSRQRVAMEELVVPGHSYADTRTLVRRLADERLIVTSVNDVTGLEEVEVAHEALIRHWPLLLGWLKDERQALLMRQGIRQAAISWTSKGEDDSYIKHRDNELKEVNAGLASARLSLGPLERRYLDACHTLECREMGNLAKTGWGVIFAADADPRIHEKLEDLLTRRAGQAKKLYRVFAGKEDGYRPDDSAREFLARHGVGSGSVSADRMPRYLLIVGDPETIPYSFQYQLGSQFAVGRIHFEDLEEYAHYARSVVSAEAEHAPARRAVVFAPQPADDLPSQIAMEGLVLPLLERLALVQPPWTIEPIIRGDATKERLCRILSAEPTPTLLFTVSHGMGFLSGDARRKAEQGALVCQDWPGPGWRGSMQRDFCFSADDVPQAADLRGMIAFVFAEYGAGTPSFGDFDFLVGFRQQEANSHAPRPFVARLPQKLLGHPAGGALAFIGHVDTTWTHSFTGELGELEVMATVLQRLMEGYPVGIAVKRFSERYAAFASELAGELPQLFSGRVQDKVRKVAIAAYDTRNWVIIGDPAVRLVLA